MPVAISFGHRLRAWLTDMFDWLLRFGSLKPSRMCPSVLTVARLAAVTLAAPQIIGTKAAVCGLEIEPGVGAQS